MKDLVIKNGTVLLADGKILPKDIFSSDGIIKDIENNISGRNGLDVTGLFVLPGFIDLHTHGIGFTSVLSEEDSLEDYARMEAEKGTTTFFPTLFASPEDIIHQLKTFRKKTDNLKSLCQVGGFRLESPYLTKPGGGLTTKISQISNRLTNEILDAGGGLIKIWDISPDLQGAEETIADLTKQGIICSLAHTNASIEQAKRAIAAGMKMVTHLFCTFEVPAMKDPGVYPIGLLDYLLVEDSLYCEIIPDGTHVNELLVEKAFRCKTSEKIIFVTDSQYGSGLKPGEYNLPSGWGTVVIKDCRNGVRRKDQDMILAGSALTPIDCFSSCVQLFHKDLQTASKVCSKNPAKLLGLNKGEIALGKDADFVVIDNYFQVVYTIVGGNIIYNARGQKKIME